jgi:hypothetical protein
MEDLPAHAKSPLRGSIWSSMTSAIVSAVAADLGCCDRVLSEISKLIAHPRQQPARRYRLPDGCVRRCAAAPIVQHDGTPLKPGQKR